MSQQQEKKIIDALKKEFHNPLFKIFLELFEARKSSNHDRLDSCELRDVKRYQGENLLLKKWLRDLTTNQPLQYQGK